MGRLFALLSFTLLPVFYYEQSACSQVYSPTTPGIINHSIDWERIRDRYITFEASSVFEPLYGGRNILLARVLVFVRSPQSQDEFRLNSPIPDELEVDSNPLKHVLRIADTDLVIIPELSDDVILASGDPESRETKFKIIRADQNLRISEEVPEIVKLEGLPTDSKSQNDIYPFVLVNGDVHYTVSPTYETRIHLRASPELIKDRDLLQWKAIKIRTDPRLAELIQRIADRKPEKGFRFTSSSEFIRISINDTLPFVDRFFDYNGNEGSSIEEMSTRLFGSANNPIAFESNKDGSGELSDPRFPAEQSRRKLKSNMLQDSDNLFDRLLLQASSTQSRPVFYLKQMNESQIDFDLAQPSTHEDIRLEFISTNKRQLLKLNTADFFRVNRQPEVSATTE